MSVPSSTEIPCMVNSDCSTVPRLFQVMALYPDRLNGRNIGSSYRSISGKQVFFIVPSGHRLAITVDCAEPEGRIRQVSSLSALISQINLSVFMSTALQLGKLSLQSISFTKLLSIFIKGGYNK